MKSNAMARKDSVMHNFDIEHIEEVLNDPDIYSNPRKSREAIRQVSKCMNKGHDLKRLLLPTMKLLYHNDMTVKKFACHFISEYSHESDVIILSVSSLLRESQSSNPIIRGMAIKTLTSLPLESINEFKSQALTAGLHDKSAYVRRIAVMSCLSMDCSVLTNEGYVDCLYGMIRDSDPIVVVNSLSVLEELLLKEDGIVMNKNIAYYLMNDLSRFSDCQLVEIIQFLSKYEPENENEVIDIINILDMCLQSDNLSTVIVTLKYALKITKDIENMQKELLKRSLNSFVTTLIKGTPEEVYNLLEFAEDIPESCVYLREYLPYMYCKFNDPSYLKTKKLSFLPRLTAEQTHIEVLDELFMYCLNIDNEVSKIAFNSVSSIMRNFAPCFDMCVTKLSAIVELDIGYVICNILGILNDFDSGNKKKLVQLFKLISSKHFHVTTNEAKSNFLHILTDYRKLLPNSAYILETVVIAWLENSDIDTKSMFLTSTMKLFLTYPAQCMSTLEKVMESCWSDVDVSLCERSQFYYQLLKTDPKLAASVILDDE